MIQANSARRSTTLILVRHGQTDWNAESRIQGQLGVDLSEVGRQQVVLTSQRLAAVRAAALYSSDLKRALASAEPIASQTGLTIQPAAELRERSFGEWEGKTWPEIEAADPTLRARGRGDLRLSPPGGEKREQVRERVVAFAERVAHDHPDQFVVAVTHGGPISQLLRWVLDMPLTTRAHHAPRNGSLTTLRCSDGQWQVVCFNDTCHLASQTEVQAKTDADFTEESTR